MPEGESENSSAPQIEAPNTALAADAVFVSYASQDSAVAEGLCAALERAGIACWMAPRDVRPGDFYADAIVQAINACRLLVLVLSESSIASAHVLREVERASSKERPVITFRIDTTPLPPGLEYFLSASQWLDASGGHAERAFPKLVEAVRRRRTGAGAEPATMPGAAREANRAVPVSRGHRILVAAVILIAAGLAYMLADKFWLSKHGVAPANKVAPEMLAVTPVAAASDKSVAVLPFTDLSEKKDQAYFSDGLSEELIDLLGKIPGLRVPARTSSFYFKGKQTTLTEIARALKVANVLEGSVRKAGGDVRISADLVRVDDEAQLWSETYDRKLDDIFKLQDEIAGAVVKALKVSLLSGDAPKATATANVDAYALYLQGRALIERFTVSDNAKGQEYLQQALRLDPKFAPGWAELAKARFVAFAALGVSTYEEARAGVVADANKAVELNPQLADAHGILGSMLFALDWDWEGAERELNRAIELDPSDPDILSEAAQLAVSQGRYQEARRLSERAVARDPLGVLWYRQLGNVYYFNGDLAQAEASFRSALRLNPASAGVHYKLALVLLKRGDAQGALAEVERESHSGWRQQGLPLALDALGRTADADRELAIAEKDGPHGWAYQVALIYAHRKNPDRTFMWLDQAYEQHDPGLATYVKGDPLLENVRTDPRYRALLRKLKLPV